MVFILDFNVTVYFIDHLVDGRPLVHEFIMIYGVMRLGEV